MEVFEVADYESDTKFLKTKWRIQNGESLSEKSNLLLLLILVYIN